MKKLFKITSSFILLTCLIYPLKSSAADWQKLTDGVQFKKLTVKNKASDVSLNVIKINLGKVSIKPVFDKSTSTAKELAEKHQAIAVINANFFDTQGKVLGLVKFDKKVINPKKNISWWSVFCIRKNRAQIIHTKNIKDGYCEQAIQAGPRLVVNGTIPKLKDEITRKSAVGINAKGEVLFVVSQQPIAIKTLADVFKKIENQGGLNCPNALNLDGGSSSQMYVEAGDVKIDISSFVKFPVGLGAFKK